MNNKENMQHFFPFLKKVWNELDKAASKFSKDVFVEKSERNDELSINIMVNFLTILLGPSTELEDGINNFIFEIMDLFGEESTFITNLILENLDNLVSEASKFKETKFYFESIDIDFNDKNKMGNLEIKKLVEFLFIKNTKVCVNLFSNNDSNRCKFIENKVNSSENQKMIKESHDLYDKVFIPAETIPESLKDEIRSKIIPVTRLCSKFQSVFENLQEFNYIQSKVFNSIYLSNRNVLVAAPTGSGKTNIALLAILKSIAYNIGVDGIEEFKNYQTPDPKNFKIVYIAPMKSLVTEIARKYSFALQKIGIKVIEITSDETVTKEQINYNHIIVTVPEKFDILTRTHSFENSLDQNNLLDVLQCIILDEIHMLGDERGPSVEAIVSRILFNIDTTQRPIRIIGLSATLPNWQDFASFLNVNEDDAYFFDQFFRPTPLEKTIIGIFDEKIKSKIKKNKSKKNQQSNKNANSIEKKNLEIKDKDAKFDEVSNLQEVYNSIMLDIIIDCLNKNEQVLVFVHSRSETLSTALYVKKMLNLKNVAIGNSPKKNLDFEHNFKLELKDKSLDKNLINYYLKMIRDRTNPVLSDLFGSGLGIHHAGLLSNQRKLSETLFTSGMIKVLFTTATLAWGVNLPARHVIIKGTNVYDNTRGKFKDLGILDILQIFGRAGRPQYEKIGSAYLITSGEKLQSYLRKLTFQTPIESQLSNISHLCNILNSEISRGSILNLTDACKWLRYTFLIIRARNSPLKYGIDSEELKNDPNLIQFSYNLIKSSLTSLYQSKLIKFNFIKEDVSSTYCGRLASKYYIDFNTVNIFRDKILKHDVSLYQTDFDILMIVGEANEFSNITTREEEIMELKEILKSPLISRIVSQKKFDISQTNSKVAILIIAYILRIEIKTPTLIMDSIYISQNSMRILRFIFELNQISAFGTSERAQRILEWSKMLEYRVFYNQLLLRYFVYYSSLSISITPQEAYNSDNLFRKSFSRGPLKLSSIVKLEEYANWDIIKDLTYAELRGIIYSDANRVLEYIKYIPNIQFKEIFFSPITSKIAKFGVKLFPSWNWQERWHGNKEKFYFWILNPNDGMIIYSQSINISHKSINNCISISDIIPIPDEPPYCLNIRVLSDKWVNLEFESEINVSSAIENFSKWSSIQNEFGNFDSKNSLEHIFEKTDLLKITPIPISVLKDPDIIKYYRNKNIFFLNPIQSQLFHVLYYSDENIFLGSPTGSGKTMIAEIAIFRILMKNVQNRTKHKIVYIAPLKSLARERLNDWDKLFNRILNVKTILITGNTKNSLQELKNVSIIISTPEKWESILRKSFRNFGIFLKDVRLIIFDEIHLVGQDPRGSVMEILICKTKYINKLLEKENKQDKIRTISLSTSLSNAKELSSWLEVNSSGYYNFSPAIRPVPCTVYISGFQEKNYCPRMATMNRPIYNKIIDYSPKKPVIIFVASRRQTRITALALSHMCFCDGNPNKFLNINSQETSIIQYSSILDSIKDNSLRKTLENGIGIHHAGLVDSDRSVVENLFSKGIIQIVVATSTLAWGVNFPAHLAIIKGTEYFDGRIGQYLDYPITDVLQMIGRAGRPQYDNYSVACIMTQESKKSFYKRFLYDSLPLESCFCVNSLIEIFNAEISSRAICTTHDALCFLSNTFFFKRLISNPVYYDPNIFQNQDSFEYINFDFKKSRIELIAYILEKMIKNVISSLVNFECISLKKKAINTNDLKNPTWTSLFPYCERAVNACSKECIPLFLYPTIIGQIASFFYIKCATVSKLNNFLRNKKIKKQEISWVEILSLISYSSEFEQHPVRHNEDLILTKISHNLPLKKLPFESMNSPFQKVFFLLQLYIFSIPVPVVDFVNDINSILEQVPRILSAFIALNKFGSYFLINALNSITLLSQCIQQKCHPFVSPLFQLPGISNSKTFKLLDSRNNFKSFYEFIYKIRVTKELDIQKLFNQLNINTEIVERFVKEIPLFQIKAKIFENNGKNLCDVKIVVKDELGFSKEQFDLHWVTIEEENKLIYLEKLSKLRSKLVNKISYEFDLVVELSSNPKPNSKTRISLISEKYIGTKISYLISKIN